MSTDLRQVTNTISQTRFFGGKDRRTCIQITQSKLDTNALPLGIGFIQLTRNDAALLAAELLRFAVGEEVEEV